MTLQINEYDTPFTKRWKSYSIWDDNNIKGFFGEYRWLSNFQPCKVWFEGLEYYSSENAYMASKTLDLNIRRKLSVEADIPLNPREAKILGMQLDLRDNWNDIRGEMMMAVVFDKFWRNLDLRRKLLDTGKKYLEETNHWGDTYYGVDSETKEGNNALGKILMKVRECLRYD